MAGPAMRVLVVDDELLIRWALTQTLAECGCDVVEAVDARSAMEALERERFDVVVLDYRLPDASDLSLLAEARRVRPDSRIIMMTAFMDADEVARALEMGASDVIEKPFALGTFAALVLNGRDGLTDQRGRWSDARS